MNYPETNAQPGDVRLVPLFGAAHHDTAKWRPAIFVSMLGDGRWSVIPLTTLPRHKNGDARVQVSEPFLTGDGYIWSCRYLDKVRDYGRLLGRISLDTVSQLEQVNPNVTKTKAQAMRDTLSSTVVPT